MPLQSSSSPRRSDAENTPPIPRLATNKSKVRGGIQGSSRRRRVRSTGGPNHPRYAIGQAKHKSSSRSQHSPVNVQLPSSPEVDVPDPVSTIPVSLPRYLSRPSFRDTAKEAITSVAPELAETHLSYIREGLQCLGPDMLKVLAGVKAEPSSNVLPTELDIVVNDLTSDMPTHMLAVYSRHVPAEAKRRVTLFPIHNIILATHCANLPLLPASNIARPDAPGSTVSLPVVPLCIPAPGVFPQLSTFLYTKRVDHLLTSLMPCPVPHPLYRNDPASDKVLALLQQFSSKLAATHSTQTLLTHAMAVNGLWRNACALGIDDEKLWCALDVAWEVLITALAIPTDKWL
ncbi:hypothetical protein V8E55_002847 [Tylopilus felleus]